MCSHFYAVKFKDPQEQQIMEARKTLGHAHCASANTYKGFMPGFMTFMYV